MRKLYYTYRVSANFAINMNVSHYTIRESFVLMNNLLAQKKNTRIQTH